MIGYACEGETWGPRRRASSLGPEVTAVGLGPRVPVLAAGQTWRSVQWCKGRPLNGFNIVVGDPGVAVLAEPDAFVMAVAINGQDFRACCRAERKPDAWWDAEAKPLHPWGGRIDLPTRGEVRERWDHGGRPVIVSLSPSWAPAMLGALVAQSASEGVLRVSTRQPEDLVGADLAVVSAGWASLLEVQACGVPYLSVNVGMKDHPGRANCDIQTCARLCALLERSADLPDDHRPFMVDHREEFFDALLCAT